MEQRIGSSSQPLDAGVNPAHIPGLTGPVSKEEPEDARPEAEAEIEAAAEEAESAAEEAAVDAEEAAAPAEEASVEAPVDGPVFEAADRRARIVADATGVRLALDDQECEFRWDEIGAVETETGRFGKRYTVTVHTPDRRWYPIEIEAKSRAQHKDWDTQLDAVLDAYFEEEATGEGPAGEEAAD
ncbi:hypothetical protein ACIQ6Y_26755 [Streptomyces sp. NPDC096205]|uniref:hypothetical protein n=1 Tax=Streptomyces sp. NPDC096205 TaxID=3366081 RepID=UPI00382F48A4